VRPGLTPRGRRLEMDRVGLIGVGNVGSGFAEKLVEAGYPLTVLDRDRPRRDRAVALGARPAETPAEVAEASGIIVLSLPGSAAVEEVMEGPAGLLSGLKAGQLVIDTGTTHPDTDIRYERLCRERGAGLIDAPITGRSKGWIIMVGGSAGDFERGREVLARLGYKVKHIGPVGQGQVLKLMNQMVLAGQWAIWAETIAFGEKLGLDPRLLSEYLEFPIPESLYGDEFSAGGQLALHYKDLGYALDLGHRSGASIPVTGLVHEVFKAAKTLGEPNWGQPGIVTYWRWLNGRR